MENEKLSVISQNLLTYCIMPNCEAHGIELRELLEYMLKTNFEDDILINNKESSSVDELKIKKKRGRPKGSKNK